MLSLSNIPPYKLTVVAVVTLHTNAKLFDGSEIIMHWNKDIFTI